jgi:hypothetical protein
MIQETFLGMTGIQWFIAVGSLIAILGCCIGAALHACMRAIDRFNDRINNGTHKEDEIQ